MVKEDVYNAEIKDIEDKVPDITNLPNTTTLNAKINEVQKEIPSINAKINEFKKEIPIVTYLAKTAVSIAKINEVKNKIPNIDNLATTTTAPTAVENKIPNVSKLVIKADYDAEMKDIKNKYFTTSVYNTFKKNILDAKLTRKKLVNECGLNEKIKKLAKKKEIKTLATKAELKAERHKIIKLQTYDSSLFIGQSYFVNDGAQLFLILQPIYYTLKRLGDTEKIVS